MVSGCTMSRMPLGRLVTTGFNVEAGTASRLTACRAQPGSLTPLVWAEANDSLPPKLFVETGLPEGWGVRMATMAWSKSRYSRATRFTSATVTRRMACTSSSGDSRPSTATACAHAMPRPKMEFF